jgi:hypothetical protein
MLDRMLQNVRVCARLTRRRSCDVVWNQMLVRSGYQAAPLCAENTYISEQMGTSIHSLRQLRSLGAVLGGLARQLDIVLL